MFELWTWRRFTETDTTTDLLNYGTFSTGDALDVAGGTLSKPKRWGLGRELFFGTSSFHCCSLVWKVRATAAILCVFSVCLGACVCVCMCACVPARVREIKSFNVTDVRKNGLLSGWSFKARISAVCAQCRLWLSRSIDILAVAYAPSNSLRELLCLVG